MNQLTEQIAGLLAVPQHEQKLTAVLNSVTMHGTLADARLLLPLFLHTKDYRLLKPIQAHGDAQISATLFKQAIQDGALKAAFPYETLLALSYLQHGPTEEVLMQYYKGLFGKNLPWDLHVAVCLALLNYPCRGYENDIREEIEKCLEEWLFPEMIPVLAVKTGDTSLAERLYQHGCTKASSDASAGLILGLALFGHEQRELFKKIILNPDWEAASTGTGNVRYTLMGMSYLNITIAELFQDIKTMAPTETERMHQHLLLLSNLVQEKARQAAPYGVRAIALHPEPYTELYEALFAPADDHPIFEVTRNYVTEQWLQESILQEFEQVQELCKLKMEHEIELEFISQKH